MRPVVRYSEINLGPNQYGTNINEPLSALALNDFPASLLVKNSNS